MKRVNALKVRQALGQVLDELDAGGPILIEKGRKPRAVLISIQDYRERFVDRVALEERRALVREILAMREQAAPGERSVVEEIRALRGPLS